MVNRISTFLTFITTIVACLVLASHYASSWSKNDLFYRSPLVVDSSRDYFGAYDKFPSLYVSWHHHVDESTGSKYWSVTAEPNKPQNLTTTHVIFFHANDAHLGEETVAAHIATLALSLNARVYAMEYIGYGLSSDSASQKVLYNQAVSFCKRQIASSPSYYDIVVHGHSMGAAVAAVASTALVAGSEKSHRLILEGAWTSTQQWLGNYLPWCLVRIVCPGRGTCLGGNAWDTASVLAQRAVTLKGNSRLRNLSIPKTVIIVGEIDTITPVYMAKELFNLDKDNSVLATIPGRGHSDTFRDASYSQLLKH